ncbi:MAG: PhoH family protein [Candidatus Tokpelaia sp.]|nr:MAG: PhoH family protein [Candidatus Tokpelaia sp.]KAA6207339.1 MAG: PhoH family protein [Candidatus Tokpelaia sp.]
MEEKSSADLLQHSFIFADNHAARLVCGICDENLAIIEQQLQVKFHRRGNELQLAGAGESRRQAQKVLTRLYRLVKAGTVPGRAETAGALAIIKTLKAPASLPRPPLPPQPEKGAAMSMPAKIRSVATAAPVSAGAPAAFAHIATRKKIIYAHTPGQNAYIAAMQKAQLVFGLGPAGTGKTYLAVAYAASLLENGLVERIILSRPAVEAGERLGFLPGDMKDKVDPYLRPLYDALYDIMPAEKVERALARDNIEIAPLAFMRGRTLAHAAIILDEAQNTTPMQMKMLLTRLGEGSHMVINGDPSQIDLPAGQQSGLLDAANLLGAIDNIALIRFADDDVVRHPLVAAIIRAYAQKTAIRPEPELSRRHAAEPDRQQKRNKEQAL